MGRYVHDETLSDLAGINASCNITTAQAERDKPCMATVTIEAALLQQILTCASLHLYDNPFRPEPVAGEYASMIEQNNEEGQDWHDLMRDAIEVLTGRLSKAQSPDYGQLKDDSVRTTRKIRKMDATRASMADRAQGERDDADLAAGETPKPDNTIEGLRAWFSAQDVRPLTGAELVGLHILLRDEPRPVDAKVVMGLLASLKKEAADAASRKTAIDNVLKVLGRS